MAASGSPEGASLRYGIARPERFGSPPPTSRRDFTEPSSPGVRSARTRVLKRESGPRRANASAVVNNLAFDAGRNRRFALRSNRTRSRSRLTMRTPQNDVRATGDASRNAAIRALGPDAQSGRASHKRSSARGCEILRLGTLRLSYSNVVRIATTSWAFDVM